jgi:GntR family transcriptional regulator
VREIRYRTIAAELRSQITAGELGAGAVLPSEADLAGSYGVSRVTVRKALEVLRDEGIVGSRQGFGWFVAAPVVRRSLGTLSTIEADLAAQGREPVRRILSFRFRDADVAGGLGDCVLEVVRVNLADGQPFALVTVWCPAELGRSLSRDDVERSTFYDLLPRRLASVDQTIRAAVADDRDAEVLGIPVGSPLLVALRVSRDAAGEAFLRAEHRFPAHLTEFVLEGS